jgi:hypothetical protein
MGNKLHGCLTEEDDRGGGGEGDNVRALFCAICRVCLSWDITHPSNDNNDNGAAIMTMTCLLLFFMALSIFPLRPDAPFNLKKLSLPNPSLSVSLNHLCMH